MGQAVLEGALQSGRQRRNRLPAGGVAGPHRGSGNRRHRPVRLQAADGEAGGKAGVPEDCVVYTLGTSMANYIALTALVHRGDEVLIEQPTYDPLLTILDHLGAQIRRFERRADRGFRLGLGELERKITPHTRLVVLCNLHNPSSALTDDETMRQTGEIAAKMGARVLVDEVYLESLFDQPWRSAFHLGPNFVITSSLTKAYGLSGIRCGWILARPELVHRMWQIVDFTYGSPVHPAERLAVIALDNLDRVRGRAS